MQQFAIDIKLPFPFRKNYHPLIHSHNIFHQFKGTKVEHIPSQNWVVSALTGNSLLEGISIIKFPFIVLIIWFGAGATFPWISRLVSVNYQTASGAQKTINDIISKITHKKVLASK